MNEIWKPVPDFPGYEASNLGKVRSLKRKTPRTLSPYRSPRGYSEVGLSRNGKMARIRVHQLVMLTFIGPAPDGTEACHNNDDRSNNRLDNLRYDTHSANLQDCAKNGKWALSIEQVQQIRQERLDGISPNEIAKKHNISARQVYSASLGATYGYIDGSIRARKVSDERAQNIREEYAKGGTSYSKLAKKYNVDQSAISLIVNGKRCLEAGGPIRGKDY